METGGLDMLKSSNLVLNLIVAALFCLVAPDAFGQQRSPGDRSADMTGYENPSGMDKRLSPEKQEQIRKRVETVRIWRLTETLKLDSETSAQLASFLSSYDRQRGNLLRERHETLQALRSAIKSSKPEETRLQPLIEKIVTNRNANQELIEQEWKSLQGILTIEQQARFIIFQQDFRRDIQRIIVNARGGASARTGIKGGQGAGDNTQSK
jgi:hypothetical protein